MTTKTKTKTAQKELADGEWSENIPEVVQKACDAYGDAKSKHSKSKAKLNTAYDNATALMEEHGIPRVRINNNEKVLELSKEKKLTIRKPKENITEGDRELGEK